MLKSFVLISRIFRSNLINKFLRMNLQIKSWMNFTLISRRKTMNFRSKPKIITNHLLPWKQNSKLRSPSLTKNLRVSNLKFKIWKTKEKISRQQKLIKTKLLKNEILRSRNSLQKLKLWRKNSEKHKMLQSNKWHNHKRILRLFKLKRKIFRPGSPTKSNS